MKKNKKQIKLKLTQAIMTKSLLEVHTCLCNNMEYCETVVNDAIDHNDLNYACNYALKKEIYNAMLELLESGKLIVNINGDEFPLIFLYNVIPSGKVNAEA